MMNNQSAPSNVGVGTSGSTGGTGGRKDQSPLDALATQFDLTHDETALIVSIVQKPDTSLETLKHPKVLQMIKQRKGRWVQVSSRDAP